MTESKTKKSTLINDDPIWVHFLQCFRDEQVSELLLKGAHGMSVVRGITLLEAQNPFDDSHAFVSWVLSLARSTGVRLDPVQGSGGGQIILPDPHGEHLESTLFLRWHCVLPPISVEGPILSLRRHRFHSVSLSDFDGFKGCEHMLKDLWHKVRGILIAGPTGSGKTTFLSSLLRTYAPLERLVVLETLPELPSFSPHSVHLCERAPSVEGVGAIGLERLLVESLRLRPDRLVFGEIRGHEAKGFYEALVMGHGAAVSTIHASSAQDACRRLASLAKAYGYRGMIGEGDQKLESHRISIGVIVLRRGQPPSIASVEEILV
jgi:Flp pilus assembly CpaF family ATPase